MGSTEITIETVTEAIVGLEIAYADIEYTSISEEPSVTIIDLIADIGGTLGLFIGISMLSFMEMAEILIKIGSILITNKFRSKKSKPDSNILEV